MKLALKRRVRSALLNELVKVCCRSFEVVLPLFDGLMWAQTDGNIQQKENEAGHGSTERNV